MDKIEIKKTNKFKGEFYPPPDKSISHRAVIFSSISKGKSIIRNFLRADDPLRTLKAFRLLGIEILEEGNNLIINGKGLNGLTEPSDVIDCGNSGTTIRLLTGLLSGNSFFSVLTGDNSLRTRPMARIIKPLKQMGAEIHARAGDSLPPIAIYGKRLKPIYYELPVSSAQVKSALILAGLYADGETTIIEPAKSRDHTERMLPNFGADLTVEGLKIKVKGNPDLHGTEIFIPGDFSSASFFIAGALLIKNSEILIKEVGLNPTRTGFLKAIKEMGATIEIQNIKTIAGEPVGDIHCKYCSELKGIDISKEMVPSMIDEFPVLCVMATQAAGTTTIRGAKELRVKESDRIKSMVTELRKMGVEVEEYEDGLSIRGKKLLKGATLETHNDHRIAMSLCIAGLIADGTSTINGISSVNISFPEFFEILRRLTS